MAEKPETTLNETNSRQPATLEEQLRRDEPPVSDDDTAPHEAISLDERLRREEPPLSDEDTSPSLMTRQLLGGDLSRLAGGRPRRGQRILAGLILLAAVGLTGLAGFIWLDTADESTLTRAPVEQAANSATNTPRPTRRPTNTPAAAGPVAAVETATLHDPLGLPTAAADEIAVALLTPAPVDPPTDEIRRGSAPFTIRSAQTRSQVIQYTVRQGDTLESIAAEFGLQDFYTIIWSNKTSSYSPLRPGVQLNILPEDGVYYEASETITIGALADEYGVDPFVIIDSEYNELFGSSPDTLLVEGMRVVIPGAEDERVNLLAANTSGGSGGAGSITGSYSLWGCTANITGGSLPVGRPLSAYTWMRGFTLGGHEGVDLAADTGTPVYAAGAGTVVFAGWNSYGYGNVIVIAHGAAFSLYGHLNSINVRCGQDVGAGAVIGTVGNTGNSSGSHLHFEIRDANFNVRNPQDYVGF